MIINQVLNKFSKISKPKSNFLIKFITILLYFSGKANIKNISRHGDIAPRTAYRQIQNDVPFNEINYEIYGVADILKHELVAIIDCTFLKKSGKCTENLGSFYSSELEKITKGLEASVIAIGDLVDKTAYFLDSELSPGSKYTRERIAKIEALDVQRTRSVEQLDGYKKIEITTTQTKSYVHTTCPQCHREIAYTTCQYCDEIESKISFYLEQLKKNIHLLKQMTKYIVADGFYAKHKFIDGCITLGLDVITKLRVDANLKYLYEGQQLGRGAPKKYDGKFNPKDLSRFEKMNDLDLKMDDEKAELYSKIMYSPQFQRQLKIVVVSKNGKCSQILCSTDLTLSARKIFEIYALRFQIEYIFRDGKSHMGLGDAQVRKASSLNFQNNACLTALNLLKIEHYLDPDHRDKALSIYSKKQQKYNEMFIQTILLNLGENPELYKNQSWYIELKNFGSISA